MNIIKILAENEKDFNTLTNKIAVMQENGKKAIKQVKARKRTKNIDYYGKRANDCFVTPTKGINSGANGNFVELVLTNNINVHKVGSADSFLIVDGKKCGCEIKTNGGHVSALYNNSKNAENKYVVYMLDVCNSNTKNVRRLVEPVVFRQDDFMNLLAMFALRIGKHTKTAALGTEKDYALDMSVLAIEPTKINWFLALDDYAYTFGTYEKGQEFTKADFDERHQYLVDVYGI